ncbi:MAG: efflux RND transporter periplasmic adaptor subunit [Planctomycetota bacterium]
MSDSSPRPPGGSETVMPTEATVPESTATEADTGGARRRVVVVAAAVVVLAGGAVVAWRLGPQLFGAAPDEADRGATVAVRRGTLEITVAENGDVRAAKRKVIRNELRWPAYIEEVARQGPISAGETIIRFKCDQLEEEIIQQEQQCSDAENAVARATADLEITTKEMEYKLTKAEQAGKDAVEDFARYVGEGAEALLKREDVHTLNVADHVGAGGEAARLLATAASDVQMAERDLVLAEDKLAFKLRANEELAPSSPYSENEIRADRLTVDRLKLKVQDAETHRQMLRQYDIPRELRRLRAAVEAAELAHDRAVVEHQQAIARARQDKQAKEMAFRIVDRKYQELLRDRDENLHYQAQEDGIVVYETGGRQRRSSDDVTIEVGEKIDPRQQLMIIPDMMTLQIETKVYESVISQVRAGLTASVRFDARPNEVFDARVARVAPMAEQGSWWTNPGVKHFEVIVKLDDDVEGLKPNMTADVEIFLGRITDALILPVDAVFEEDGRTYCYVVLRDGRIDKTPVTVGRSNRRDVEILGGLQAGAVVRRVRPEGGETEQDAASVPPGRRGAGRE